MKALVLHTPDEAGDYLGPDYRFGWGLMDCTRFPYAFAGGEIISWAYNTMPGAPIQAGAVPEPSTWAC